MISQTPGRPPRTALTTCAHASGLGLSTRMRVVTSAGRTITLVPNRRADGEHSAHEFGHFVRTGSLPS